MATVTKPIALDESINTTEQTPRNIADVLAEELKGIADNILPPNASQIAYDNTASGLTATNVQDAIDEVISSQADVIADTMADLTENKTATVTDGVADFETIDGSLVKSLVVSIEPNQSGTGTPSPSNIRPITGWTQEDVTVAGKNLLDRSAFVDGYVNYTGGISPASPSQQQEKVSDFIRVKEGESYTFQVSVNTTEEKWIGIGLYYANKDFIQRISGTVSESAIRNTFTVPEGGAWVRVSYRTYGIDEDAQLELGSTATTFEPYHGKTYTTPFNQTVYGGTLDVVTGELTITHGMSDLGSLTWIYDSKNLRFSTRSLSEQYKNLGSRLTPLLTSIYAALTHGEPFDINLNYLVYSGGSDNTILVQNHDYTDARAFKTAMNGIPLVYELATPTTIQLTPQKVKSLVGENHIMASTGDVLECKYSMLINGDDLEMLLS